MRALGGDLPRRYVYLLCRWMVKLRGGERAAMPGPIGVRAGSFLDVHTQARMIPMRTSLVGMPSWPGPKKHKHGKQRW